MIFLILKGLAGKLDDAFNSIKEMANFSKLNIVLKASVSSKRLVCVNKSLQIYPLSNYSTVD